MRAPGPVAMNDHLALSRFEEIVQSAASGGVERADAASSQGGVWPTGPCHVAMPLQRRG